MKTYKLKAISKQIVILNAVAYKHGETIEITIDEETLEKIKPFIDIVSIEDTDAEVKTNKKKVAKKEEDSKLETLDNFIDENF